MFNEIFLDGILSVKRKIVISIFLNNTLGEIATAIKKVNVKPVGTVRAILHECFTIIKITNLTTIIVDVVYGNVRAMLVNHQQITHRLKTSIILIK